VTRLGSGAEELRQRCEPRPRRPAGEQPPCQSDRVDHGTCEARARQALRLAIEKREVESCVVCDEHRVARELEEPPHSDRGMRRSAQVRVAQAGDRRDHGSDRHAGVDEQLEVLLKLEVVDAHRADLADP
jgi:hypothetical protein